MTNAGDTMTESLQAVDDAAEDWLLDASVAPAALGDLLQPLYDGAAAGLLVLPFCAGCGLPLDLEQRACDGCHRSEVAWRPVEARGQVHSATLVHRIEKGLVRVETPYPVVDVELSSGHRLIMTALHEASDAPAIGDEVAVGFRSLGGVALPAYTKKASTTAEDEEGIR